MGKVALLARAWIETINFGERTLPRQFRDLVLFGTIGMIGTAATKDRSFEWYG